MSTLSLALIIFGAALLQTLAGFGFAIVVMPPVVLLLGLRTAVPLVALVAGTLYLINLLRLRQALDLRSVMVLAAASALGVPVGVWVLGAAQENLVRQALGLLLVAYAGMSLLRPLAVSGISARWAWPAGFLAGCLAGAYNTPGPPLIVYGTLKHWPRDEFRCTLQALFLVNSAAAIVSHALARHYSAAIMATYLGLVPALLLGVWLGAKLDGRLDGDQLRRLLMAFILLLGLMLLLLG